MQLAPAFRPSEADVWRAIYTKHLATIRRLDANLQLQKKALADAYTAAKKDQVDGDELKIGLDTGSAKKETKHRIHVGKVRKVFDALGIPIDSQGDLFASTRDADWDPYFEAGKTAALLGEMRKPPPELAQHEAQRWTAGHCEGTTIANVVNSEGFKRIGDVVSAGVAELASKAGLSSESLGASVLDDDDGMTEH